MSINNSDQAIHQQQHSEMIIEEAHQNGAGANVPIQAEQQRPQNGQIDQFSAQTQMPVAQPQSNNQQPSSNDNNQDNNSNQNSSNQNAIEDISQNQPEFRQIEMSDYFYKGSYLDVREHLGDWRVGIVLQIFEKQHRLHIQFDGSKSEEYVQMNSNKLAHFRRFTRGYTGEKGNAYRLKRSIEDIKQMIKPYKQMVKNNFQDVTAFNYNQEFRGKYYLGMDQALQNICYDYNVPEIMIKLIKSHIDYTIKYIRDFPNYFAEYNKIYTNLASYLYELPVAIAHGSFEMFELLLSIFGAYDRLILNQNCFYAKNWVDLKQSQNLILEPFNDRIVKIQSTNLLENDDNDGMQDEIMGGNMQMQQQSLIHQQKSQLKQKIKNEIIPIFTNYFWLNGGLDAMNSLLNNPNKMIPLESLLQIIRINSIGFKFMKKKFVVPLIDLLCSYVIQRMSLLTEREIKEYDPYLVRKIREILQDIVKSHLDQESTDIYFKRIDEMDLNIALKLLSSQYLNKKIQGLNDISEIITEIKQNDSFQNGNNNDDVAFRNNSEYYSDSLNDRRYNPKEFTEWVIKNKIIDHLLGDSMHVEIVRRCHEIIRFMCFCKQFPVELIDTIWNSCGSDKHEAIVAAIFEMIISITDQLSKEALYKFHEKINSIPLHEINEQTLMLIRGFSQKAIDRLIPSFKMNYQSQGNQFSQLIQRQTLNLFKIHSEQQGSDTEELEEGQDNENQEEHKENHQESKNKAKENLESQHEKNFFCLELLLKLINEDNNQNLSQLVVDNSLQIAKDLLCLQQGAFISKKYVNLFLDQITSGRSSYQAYYLIYALIDSQYRPDILLSLQSRQIDLPRIIVDDICSYLASIPECFNKLQPSVIENIKNSPNQAYAYKTTVFKGKYSHENNIHVRFQLLEIVLTQTINEKQRIFQLSSQEFDKLWNQFIKIPNNYCESQIFLNWIHSKTIQKQNQNYVNQIDISNLFTLDLMKHIFFNIFCNSTMMKYQSFSPELFNIFFFLFKKINLKSRNIELITNLNKFKVINEELAGMKTMWDIFGECDNKQVVTSCCDQLSEIYLNHEKNWEPQFRDHYMRQLTEKCMQFLQEGYNKHSSQLIERAVQLLILFFSKIEGLSLKKYDMQQQNQYSQYPVNQSTFTIINQSENIRKDIKVNQNIPFGLLRKKIAFEFKYPTTSFRLFCKTYKQFIEPFQDEEIIHSARNVYYVHLIEGADMENAFHPKNFITQNNEYFDLLFSLLSLNFPTDDCNNNLWELIMKLPINDHVKQSIIKMQEPWEEILKGSFHKKLYCLNIMDELLQNSNQNNQWLQRFIQSHGYKFLYEQLSQLDVNIIQNTLSKKFVRRLLKIISFLHEFKLKGDFIFQDMPEKGEAILSQCFQTLVECIHRICEYCILREEKDLENCSQEKLNYNHQIHHYQRMQNQNQNCNQQEPKKPDFYTTEVEIVQSCFSILNHDHYDKIPDLFCHPLVEKIIKKGLAQIDNIYLQHQLYTYLNFMYQNCKNKPSTLKHLLPTLLHNILPDIVRFSKVNGVLIQQNNLMIPENIPLETFRAEQTRYFFLFSSQIITLAREIPEITTEFDFVATAMNITEMILARPVLELSQNNKDEILIGLITLLKDIVLINPSLSVTLTRKFNLIKQILDFSFDFPQITKKSDSIFSSNSAVVRGPKIKSSETRKFSFELLKQLSINVPENIYQIIKYLQPLILSGDWRTKNSKDWDIVPKKNEKSSTGYVGIKNLGCICYMNSLLQQLFMIPSFRQTILRCKDSQFETSPQEDNILYQLKCMFTNLCYSEKEAYNPKAFCHAFKDYDGNPTNVFEQMDIDEFFNSLMDKLENQMKGTKHADAIKKHFGGVFSNEIISKGCQHYSEREEAYLSISLQVKNKKDIKASLEALTQGEMLEGDNSYQCEKCDKKVVALKRTCLKKLPNHLILVLKRFEFNYDNMQKVKINQLCSFPDEIDFQEFSQQGLRKAEQAQNKQQKQQHSNDVEYPDNYFKYRLYGIGIHMGIADSGHYYSYIRDRDTSTGEEKWMEFNDNVVKFFDPKDIPNEAFGGEEKWKQFYMMENMNMMNAFRQKIRNAYLLFYDRIEKFDEDQFQQANANQKEKDKSSDQNVQILEFDDEQDDEEKKKMKMEAEEDEELVQSNQEEEIQSNAAGGADAASLEKKEKDNQGSEPKIEVEDTEDYEEKYCGEFKQEILKQNMSFHLHKILFSQEFSYFMNNLIFLYNQTLGENKHPLNYPYELDPNNISKDFYDLNFIKFSLTYFFTTAIRQRVRQDNQNSLESFFYFITTQLNKNVPAIQWLIKCFTDPRLVREILMSPSTDAKDYVVAILEQCCKTLYNLEKGHLHDIEEDTELPKTMLGQFINCLILSFNQAENYQEYFELFFRLIHIDDEIGQYLVNRMFIGRIMEFLFSSESKGKKKNNMQYNNNNSIDFPKTPIDISEVPMMGLPSQEKQKKTYDSFYKKDRSGFADSCCITYLLRVLEYLILRSSIPSNNPAKIPSKINYNLQKDEFLQLYRDQESMNIFIQKSKDKQAVKAINNILAYLSYEDGVLSEYICFITALIVQDQQCQEYVRSFSLLKKVFSIQDSLQQKRIEIALQKMYGAIEANLKYQKELDVIQQFSIKLCAHNTQVAQVYHKNQQLLSQFIKIIQDYRPTRKDADENAQKKDRNELQYYDIRIPTSLSLLNNLRNWKIRQLEKLKSGDFTFDLPHYDTDDILPESEIQKGRYYDLYDEKENKWKSIRCFEMNLKRRVAYFYEVSLDFLHNNLKEEKELYEKQNQFITHFLPLGTYKLFPFKTMIDSFAVQLQSDEEESEQGDRRKDENDDKKNESENNSPLNQQNEHNNSYYQNNPNEGVFQLNQEENQSESEDELEDNDHQNQDHLQTSEEGDDGEMGEDHEQEDEEESDEEEDDNNIGDEYTDSYQQNRYNN